MTFNTIVINSFTAQAVSASLPICLTVYLNLVCVTTRNVMSCHVCRFPSALMLCSGVPMSRTFFETLSFKPIFQIILLFSCCLFFMPLSSTFISSTLISFSHVMSCHLFSIHLVNTFGVCCVCAGQEEVPTIAAVYGGATAPVNTGIPLPFTRHTSSDVHSDSTNISVTHPRFPEL